MLAPWASLTPSPGHYSLVCTHQRAEKSRWEPSAPSPPPLCGPPVPTTSHHLPQAGDTTQHVRAVRCLGLTARARPRCQKVLWVRGSCDLTSWSTTAKVTGTKRPGLKARGLSSSQSASVAQTVASFCVYLSSPPTRRPARQMGTLGRRRAARVTGNGS